MTERKKLIEVALPLEAISAEGSLRKRKAPAGYPTTIHKWWAQRPPAACRAVIFGSLVDDPSSHPDLFPTEEAQDSERRRLFDVIRRLVRWENSGNESVLNEARAEIQKSFSDGVPPLLDPFCGGGSIPMEAQRLGLEAYASDLNPVAVLITKALIDIPARFAGCAPVHPDARQGVGATGSWAGAAGLAEDVRRYGAWVRDEASARIGHLYPSPRLPNDQRGDGAAIAWLWARTVTCPNPACGAAMPLIRSFALATKPGKRAWLEPVVDRASKAVRYIVKSGVPTEREWKAIIAGTGFVNERGKKVQATFRCVVCGTGIARGEYIDSEADKGGIGQQILSVVVEGLRGRTYIEPDAEDTRAIDESERAITDPDTAARLPGEPARGTFASNAQGRIYGFRRFRDYFTPRQLLALDSLTGLIKEVRELVRNDAQTTGMADDQRGLEDGGTGAIAYGDAVATYLALALDRVADYGNSLASWRPKDAAMRSLFTRQAIPMVWDFAEGNPFGKSSSGWTAAVAVVARVLEFAVPGIPAHASQLDARYIDKPSRAIVATDPPYYDNVGYADLSDFFHVWLRRSVGSTYPSLFATLLTPKGQELVATPHRFDGDARKADEFFEDGLRSAFVRMRELAHNEVPITLFYAFKQSESDDESSEQRVSSTGWETMLQALIDAGLRVVGTWPLRTEGDNRAVGVGANALASSIVLVCRNRGGSPRVTTRRDFIAELTSALPDSLRRLQQESIAPVDLAQAAIGPGMGVFSQYTKVIEPDGSPMTVRSALGLINAALDQIVSEQEGEFDPDTRWAITWFEQHGLKEGRFGDAETLSKAKDTAVGGLERSGIIRAGGGKVRLLGREDLMADWNPATDRRPTVWEATQHLVRALEREGESGAGELAARIGGYAQLARDLAYRLYLVCERKGWAEEAVGYNQLVVAWPEIERLAHAARTNQQQQNLNL